MLVALKGQARAVEHGRARHRFAFLGPAGLTALGDVNRAESRAASSGTESLNRCCASAIIGDCRFTPCAASLASPSLGFGV
jgi:hypothetical protein